MQDAQQMKPGQKFQGHTEWVSGIIQLELPGRQQIMTCSGDGSLRVWNLQTGKQIANWRDGKSDLYSIALSPDGKTVLSGSFGGAVRLWDIDTRKVIATWTGHTGAVSSVCWNQDAGRVVTQSSSDGTARVWDVESGKAVLRIETAPSQNLWTGAVIYSPDGTMIATSNARTHTSCGGRAPSLRTLRIF